MSGKDNKGHVSALERFRDALYTAKIHAGSTEKLSAVTGLPNNTLKSYLSFKSKPTLESLCMIIQGLGAEFVNELLEPLGITGAYDKDPDRLTGFGAIAQMAHSAYLLSIILKQLRHFRPEERRVVEHQIAALKQILNPGEGAI